VRSELSESRSSSSSRLLATVQLVRVSPNGRNRMSPRVQMRTPVSARATPSRTTPVATTGADESAVEVFKVPGSFELPLTALKAAQSGDFDAVIAIGVVIRGETPHFDYVAGQAASGIAQAGIETGIPVVFGVVTTDTVEQAINRSGVKSGNKGYEAAMSAVEMVNLYSEMASRESEDKGQDKVFPHVV